MREPSEVTKATSTTASSGNGLKSDSSSWAPGLSLPVGRYHDADGADAQGPPSLPSLLVMRCSTETSPPSTSTSAALYGAAWMSARRTVTRPDAGTATLVAFGASAATACAPAASPSIAPGYTVILACRPSVPALAMSTKPSAAPSG